ncbi:MAG: hypothetical protein AB1325_14100 [Nitrospirota bacterium]
MRALTVKLTDTDIKKLKEMKGDKAVSTFIRELIRREYERTEESIGMTAEFLRTIKNADLSKIAEKTDEILHRLNGQNGDGNHEVFKKLEQEIGVMKTIVAVIAFGLPSPKKDLKEKMPAIYSKLQNVLGRE